MIKGFSGANRFLSNFYPSSVEFEGLTYMTVEHAYQAAKTTDPTMRSLIMACQTPGSAKTMGRQIVLRPDWLDVRLSIMKRLLEKKFYDSILRAMLLETGEEYLEETNYWHDNFWGKCTCSGCLSEGTNHLGLLLMEVRQELRG